MHFALQYRLTHYVILLAAVAVIGLPRLGEASLWDMDEGLNAEAAREMHESGNWIVPKFNFQLRDAKPALLYWAQGAAYQFFGMNEFAARLPSVIAAALATLLTYELGRRMFSPVGGLLGGVALISSSSIAFAARFANPDALLLACTALTFFVFWHGYVPRRAGESPRRGWFIPVGIACGLATLAKGPVGVLLPALVIGVFLIWQRQLRLLFDRRALYGMLAFLLVAAPWYVLVSVVTRGEFATGFFITNNVRRFLEPMEYHRGPILYHPAILLSGLAPWSIFVGFTFWYAVKVVIQREKMSESGFTPLSLRPAYRLLVCWVVVYVLFFTIAATKLPNYTLPVFPAIALLTGRFLDSWQRREINPPRWLFASGLVLLILIGISTSLAMLVIGGDLRLPGLEVRQLAGLGKSWWIGLLPLVGGTAAAVAWLADRREWAISAVGVAAVGFLAAALADPLLRVDSHKPCRDLVAESGAFDRRHEIRLASFQFTQPSLVFYSQREVRQLLTDDDVAQFLHSPLPVYLFVPESAWNGLSARHPELLAKVRARKWDFYRKGNVLVVSNQ